MDGKCRRYLNKALHAAGGLQDVEGDVGFGALHTESVPAPDEPFARQMPWTQQPSEAQLPQTQQQFSPSIDVVGAVVVCEPAPSSQSMKV